MRGGRGVVEGRRLGGRADGRTSVQRGGRGGGVGCPRGVVPLGIYTRSFDRFAYRSYGRLMYISFGFNHEAVS